MTFTSTPPSRPGFYAWKESHKDAEIILATVYLDEEAGELLDESSLEPPGVVGGLWCPLLPAEEVENAYREALKDCNGSLMSDEKLWLQSNARKIVEGDV